MFDTFKLKTKSRIKQGFFAQTLAVWEPSSVVKLEIVLSMHAVNFKMILSKLNRKVKIKLQKYHLLV